MKAVQGFTTVDVVIETQAELDVLLDALSDFINSPERSCSQGEIASHLRVTIGEAAGL